jgi:hypothetical protein
MVPSDVPVDSEAKRLVKVGDGRTLWTSGDCRAEVTFGDVTMRVRFTVMPTTAFRALLGIRFLRRQEISDIYFHPPAVRIKETVVPLLLVGAQDVLTYLAGKTLPMEGLESYRVLSKIRSNALTQLQVSVRVVLFSSAVNRVETLFCTPQTSAWFFDWSVLHKEMGVLWANPPFSKILTVITKAALEPCRIALVTPEWTPSSWTRVLDRLTVKRVPLLEDNGVLYVDDQGIGLPAPTRRSNLTLIDSVLNCLDPSELDAPTVAWIQAKTRHYGEEHLEHTEEEDIPPPTTHSLTPTQTEETVKDMVSRWLAETNEDTMEEWEHDGHILKHVNNPEDTWRSVPESVPLQLLLLLDNVSLSGEDDKEYERLVKRHEGILNKVRLNDRNPMKCTFSLNEDKKEKTLSCRGYHLTKSDEQEIISQCEALTT